MHYRSWVFVDVSRCNEKHLRPSLIPAQVSASSKKSVTTVFEVFPIHVQQTLTPTQFYCLIFFLETIGGPAGQVDCKRYMQPRTRKPEVRAAGKYSRSAPGVT